jgi:hypothetical protein
MQIHWSGATRYHDWLGNDRALARRMLKLVRDAGLIGEASWYSVGSGARKPPRPNEDVFDTMLARKPRRDLPLVLAAGGDSPFPWELTLLLSSYDADDGEVRGYSMFNLWFPLERVAGEPRSDELVALFRQVHHRGNTEFALLHPYPRAAELADVLDGAFGEPLTASPMFAGVYWAVFLGKGHLDLFDVAQLQDLDAYEVEWDGDDSLFLRVSPDIATATSDAVEAKMIELTEVFRRARRQCTRKRSRPRPVDRQRRAQLMCPQIRRRPCKVAVEPEDQHPRVDRRAARREP